MTDSKNKLIPDAKEASAIRAGQNSAFDRLYDQFAPRIIGFGLRLTGNRAEAEDLTQETFLAAFTGRESLGGQSKPLSWLLGIAWRRWRDNLRHTAAGIQTQPLVEEIHPTVDPTAGMATTITIESALQRLAPPMREALLLTAGFQTPISIIRTRISTSGISGAK